MVWRGRYPLLTKMKNVSIAPGGRAIRDSFFYSFVCSDNIYDDTADAHSLINIKTLLPYKNRLY